MTAAPLTETVLAVDPGRAKCGLAVVVGPEEASPAPRCRARRVVDTERLTLEVAALLREHSGVSRLLLGDGTHSATLRKALAATFPDLPLSLVNEFRTSARARRRFVRDNPAPGWRRLLPSGLRSPEVPYDDYAALLLAEDYFARK